MQSPNKQHPRIRTSKHNSSRTVLRKSSPLLPSRERARFMPTPAPALRKPSADARGTPWQAWPSYPATVFEDEPPNSLYAG